MNAIEAMDAAAFHDYLRRYQNTICGRHPIGVFLQVSQIIYSKRVPITIVLNVGS